MRPRTPLYPLIFAAVFACNSTENLDEPTAFEAQNPDGASTAPHLEANAAEMASSISPRPAARAASFQPTSQDGSIDDVARKLELRRQQQTSIAEQYLETGLIEFERGDLETALGSFTSALEVDPGNEAARQRLDQVAALLGNEVGEAGDRLEDEVSVARLRRAQARIAAEDYSRQGDQALRDGEYQAAVEYYRQAENILRWHPQIATESLDERLVSGRLDEAMRLRDENVASDARVREEEATRMAQVAEQAQVEREATQIREYFELADQAFLSDDFEGAESWARQVLIVDPGNEAAMELERTAREARHARVDERNRKNYREQWLRTFDELGTMSVPQTDAIAFDYDRWRDVRERQPLAARAIDIPGAGDREAILNKLDTLTFAPNFGGPDGDGTPLADVAAYMQSLTGINFIVSSTVRDELDEEETSINLQLPKRTVHKVLDIMAETSENLRWKVDNGVVTFVTKDELVGGQVLRTYAVQDLIKPVPDYAGREINISPSGGLVPLDEDIEEREANVVTIQLLEDLIRGNVSPESWDADPANSLRITEMGQLVVNQTPEVHIQIQEVLEDLREATGIMVDIQTRFMKVEDNFLEDIGVDFRGLGQPGLGVDGRDFNDFGDPSSQVELGDEIGQGSDLGAFYDEGFDGDIRARTESLYDQSLGNPSVLQGSGGLSFQWTFLNDLQLELILRAVSKSERVEIVTAPRLTVHNTARANLAVLNQVAYVQDFDVEIAQAASIADPIVAVIEDGVILDVRPVVSADRRFITLELRPTIAQLRRPIAEQVTTLGSQNSVTIQLPEVEIQKVRTSIPIPDGGTVLLGGQKVSERQDFRSGVPILNKIPILSALFERKGNYISNRKLLILLRASIVIPEEIEPTAAELGVDE